MTTLTTEIHDMGFEILVPVYLNGEEIRCERFLDMEQAQRFASDPLAYDRRQSQLAEQRRKENEEILIRNASLIGCNRGRQIGPNRRGSL